MAIVFSIEDASDAKALDGVIHSLAWIAAFAHILEAVMLVCLKKQGYID
jgi:hypothetical protein